MATVALRKFTNADTLKHIGGPHLFPLLSPHRLFFAGRGLILPLEEKLKAEDGNSEKQKAESRNGDSTPHPESLSPVEAEREVSGAGDGLVAGEKQKLPGEVMEQLHGPRKAEDGNGDSTPHPESLSPIEAERAVVNGIGHFDYEKLASIFMTPDTDMPRDLADALYLIHEMSTKEAMDKLQEAAERCRPPLDLNGADEPADVAVRVWLLNRALIEEVNAEHELARPKAFLSYLMDDGPVPQFVLPTDATRFQWEKRMSVRHPRTRPMSFVNGNREWVARSSLLSTRMECSANHRFIERSEPNLMRKL
jgi:hypothetical protein